MVRNRLKKISAIIVLISSFSIFISACATHSGKKDTMDSNAIRKESTPKVVATSMATAEIMDKLGVNLVGVVESKVDKLPERYRNSEKVGMAMSPDLEKIKALKPDWVFAPVSLVSDLQPKFSNAKLRYGFLNLNNIPGMYKSISDLGKILDREKESEKLVKEYKEFINSYEKKNRGKKKPSVLILMGLPGSYVVATDKSYVGSLVKMAGGKNVFSSEKEQFMNINTEEMLKKNPDIILRTAHALPDDVMKMFGKEFKENDIWSHFKAVRDNKVYDLDHKKFGMSAKFNYPSALDDLQKIFYGGIK